MSVYRRKYTISGKTRTSKFYTVDFVGPDGKQVRKATKLTTRQAAEKHERDLRASLENGAVGIIDRKQAKESILARADEYVAHLADKGRDEMYRYTVGMRLKRLSMEAGWRSISDVSIAGFDAWSRKAEWRGRKIKPKTSNQFLSSAKEFLDWCVSTNRCASNPLAKAQLARENANPYYRRAATVEELDKLLKKSPEDRREYYLFSIYCPLRRGTIRQLVWRDLHLDDEKPWGVIRPEINKTRKPERFPIPQVVADSLKKRFGKPGEPVFKSLPTIDQLREDLLAAGIQFDDDQGNQRFDFHAFRKTAITLLQKAGVPVQEAKELLHHKDLKTTMKHYTQAADPVATDALAKMPKLGE